ncbi:hypothetical protein SASPL_106984 [Salvia splendens]|uniref:TauD/TfdA-like domain-containing protein n=1 Tax=Salvia splendens TaxID=180675 RepID=A0A8X8YF91_SALSN|nr:clavaminate synthase-like protein At3g21360 [Salvia splendens]KAG6428945.1 hypothetical protein SASPL_106984 [Salvia splendens]
MPTNSSAFAEAKITEQKIHGGVIFPAVLTPVAAAATLTVAVKEQRPWLDSVLHKHGAVLFRGFESVATATDFNDVVEAFGYEELPYVGGAAPRTNVVGRVFTANESPPDQKIPFHHEMAQVPKYPTKLFFFCETEPVSGGETPIVPSHVVYERMKEKHPEFVDKLEKHGVIYTRVLGEEDDPSSPIGRGWKSTFLTANKAVAEERYKSLHILLISLK